MKELIDAFKKYTGLAFITRPEEDEINKALLINKESDGNELANGLLVLSNYLIYLKYEFAQIHARVAFLRESLNKELMPVAAKMKTTYDKDERKYTALAAADEANQTIAATIEAEKIKLDLIGPVLDGIKTKVDCIRTILERKRYGS